MRRAFLAATLLLATTAAAAADMPLNGAPVDVCALLSAADAEAAIGKLNDPPAAKPAQGSLLGQCDYHGAKGMAMVSARPAAEYDATLRYATKKTPGTTVSGLAGPATQTSSGLLLQPPGKPYFVHIFVVPFGGDGAAMSAEAAKRLTFK